MYKQIIGAIVLAFSLALSTTVFADTGECGERMKQMIESLNLDSSQKDKIKPILDNLKSKMKDSMSQMQDLRKKIQDQVTSSNMDQSAVNSLVDQKTKLIGDMMKAKIAAKNQIYGLLTDKQKTQWQDAMKKMEDKMAEKFKSCHEEE